MKWTISSNAVVFFPSKSCSSFQSLFVCLCFGLYVFLLPSLSILLSFCLSFSLSHSNLCLPIIFQYSVYYNFRVFFNHIFFVSAACLWFYYYWGILFAQEFCYGRCQRKILIFLGVWLCLYVIRFICMKCIFFEMSSQHLEPIKTETLFNMLFHLFIDNSQPFS